MSTYIKNSIGMISIVDKMREYIEIARACFKGRYRGSEISKENVC